MNHGGNRGWDKNIKFLVPQLIVVLFLPIYIYLSFKFSNNCGQARVYLVMNAVTFATRPGINGGLQDTEEVMNVLTKFGMCLLGLRSSVVSSA